MPTITVADRVREWQIQMETNEKGFRSCPFCGFHPVTRKSDGLYYLACDCGIVRGFYTTPERARDDWNERR